MSYGKEPWPWETKWIDDIYRDVFKPWGWTHKASIVTKVDEGKLEFDESLVRESSKDEGDSLIYTIDLPGVKKPDLRLTQGGGELVVEWKRGGKARSHRVSVGDVAVESAKLEDGVLTVRMSCVVAGRAEIKVE